MRHIAIGDVHGCLKTLQVLIEKIDPKEDDVLIFLGDYVDRGPDPAGVIQFLIGLKEKHPDWVFLKGNHEDMFLHAIEGNYTDTGMFLANGGTATINSYGEFIDEYTGELVTTSNFKLPKSHLEFLKSLDTVYVTETHAFVHAGVPQQPINKWKDTEESYFVWVRDAFIESNYNWGRIIVYGHTPCETPRIATNKIGIDTACVYGRGLTAYIAEEDKFIRVPSEIKRT